jgi:hypothetical protein
LANGTQRISTSTRDYVCLRPAQIKHRFSPANGTSRYASLTPQTEDARRLTMSLRLTAVTWLVLPSSIGMPLRWQRSSAASLEMNGGHGLREQKPTYER